MSKEERYTYHCDQYDYVEIIYDNEECEEIDSMKMAEKRLNRQQDKISDLEAKLAESEKQNKSLYFEKESAEKILRMSTNEQTREILELKQQLAEKDAERELDNSFWKQECDSLQKALAEKEKERHEEWKTGKEWKWEWQKVNQKLKKAEQDKISFAVEQINKIKNDLYENEKINIRACDFDEIDNIFDNQIKQLKEMK